MAIPLFLAMTGAQFQSCSVKPAYIAWMGCHFSPYGAGLSNLPPALPSGSAVMVNDRIPICGHRKELIAQQLQQITEQLPCSGIVLDFQRTGEEETARLARYLVSALSCPVAVSDHYAKELDCPVFLSPCPHHVPLSSYLQPWKGRSLWLDLASDAETITLTRTHSRIHPLPLGELPEGGHSDSLLHCHYSIESRQNQAQFTLWRTKEDRKALAREAEDLGAEAPVGLYSEWEPER